MNDFIKQLEDLLRELKHLPRVAVGGGCLRDHLLGKPIKDIDIFIGPYNGMVALGDMLEVEYPETPHLPDGWRIEVAIDAGYFSCDVDRIYMVTLPEGHPLAAYPVQIMVMRESLPLEDLAARMDFGLCQIVLGYLDADSTHLFGCDTLLYYTPAFSLDRVNKRFTYCPSVPDGCDGDAQERRLLRALDRKERLQEKYPDHQFIIPPLT